MYDLPRIGVIAEAIKRELVREFPGVPVRRSYRADIDLDDEPRGPVITVMPDDCAFDPSRSRDCLWQEVSLIVAVTAPLDPDPEPGFAITPGDGSARSSGSLAADDAKRLLGGGGTLGEGWNERIDPLVAIVERIQEIFTGGRIITADRVGDLDVTLVEGTHAEGAPLYDFDELIVNSRFLGVVNVHTRFEVPRDPNRMKGSA